MTAGLPSAGIGGLFYLGSAILLPFRSAWRRLRGAPDHVSAHTIVETLAVSFGMLGGMWLAGWMLAMIIPASMLPHDIALRHASARGLMGRESLVRASFFALALLTLATVLGAVEVMRIALGVRSQRRRVRAAG